MPHIKLIAIDLDGTLLDSRSQLSERNTQAIRTAMASGVQVIIATGKTPASAAPIREKTGLRTPGVFTQGLIVCNADGSVRSQVTLSEEAVNRVFAFCSEHGFTYFAYSVNRIFTGTDTPFRHLLSTRYHEPEVELMAHPNGYAFNKILITLDMASDVPAQARTTLGGLLGEEARVIQSVSESLEILPPGQSKGAGVRRLLAELGINPADVLAIGDGENDLEFIQMAGLGVAVGNAHAAVKAAADHIVSTNDEDGVAEAIERFVLQP